jgi:hypothetical protein
LGIAMTFSFRDGQKLSRTQRVMCHREKVI